MEAKLQRHGDVTVVHLHGQIDLEKNQNFRQFCLREFKEKKVVFSLDGLQFVGSSGIQVFFRTLAEIHAGSKHGIKIAGLKPDFMRVLRYAALPTLEVHETADFALESFATGIPGGIQFIDEPTAVAQPIVDSAEEGEEPLSS